MASPSKLHSAERRLYEKLGMENPNQPKPTLHTSSVGYAPEVAKVRYVSQNAGKKIPPPVATKPVFYNAQIHPGKVFEKATLTGDQIGGGPKSNQASEGKKKAALSMEDELAQLTDLLVKNLDNTGDPDFFGEFGG